jgi:hypothetical protein
VAVVTLAVGVPEEEVVVKQDGAGCNRDVGVLRKTCLEITIAQVVTEPRDYLSKT